MGSSPSQAAEAPVVVIIGAGYGGATVARKLEGAASVVLIERKAYGQYAIASLRAAVNQGVTGDEKSEDWRDKVFAPLNQTVNRGCVVHGDVTAIDAKSSEVTIEGRDAPIKFDYLVVCSGSQNCMPGKAAYDARSIDEVREAYAQCRTNIEDAKSILIVGGGPVGVELLGEIKDGFPEKKITLVHSRAQLISNPDELGEDFRKMATDRARAYTGSAPGEENPIGTGSTLILGERVDFDSDPELAESAKAQAPLVGQRVVRTNKGTEIETDLIFWTVGLRKLTEFVGDSLPRDKKGGIIVGTNLLVEGHKNIFAVGDCNSLPGNMAFYANKQGEVCAKNIKNLISGKEASNNWEAPTSGVMFLCIGTNEGVCKLPWGAPKGRKVTQMVKGDLMVKDSMKTYWGIKSTDYANDFATTKMTGPLNADTSPKYLITDEGIPYAAKALGISEAEAKALQSK